MLNKLKTRNPKGFTIIEVLIVLAIAGLILLVVLLAVPALQRNSRNTAIKNDASAVAGGISEFESNNDGAVPTAIAGTGTVNISSSVSGTQPTSARVQGGTVVSVVSGVPGAGAPSAGTINVYLGHRCDGTASTRAAAIFYSIENSSSTLQQKCADS